MNGNASSKHDKKQSAQERKSLTSATSTNIEERLEDSKHQSQAELCDNHPVTPRENATNEGSTMKPGEKVLLPEFEATPVDSDLLMKSSERENAVATTKPGAVAVVPGQSSKTSTITPQKMDAADTDYDGATSSSFLDSVKSATMDGHVSEATDLAAVAKGTHAMEEQQPQQTNEVTLAGQKVDEKETNDHWETSAADDQHGQTATPPPTTNMPTIVQRLPGAEAVMGPGGGGGSERVNSIILENNSLNDMEFDAVEEGIKSRRVLGASITKGTASDIPIAAKVVSERNIIEATAVSIEEQKNDDNSGSNARQRCYILIFAIVIVIVTVIGLSIGLTTTTSQQSFTGPNSGSITNTTVNDAEYLLDLLSSISDVEMLSNTITPQYAAMKWLLHSQQQKEDEQGSGSNTLQELYTDAQVMERYALAVLFFATGGNSTWKEQLGFLDQSMPVCEWGQTVNYGSNTVTIIECNDEGSLQGLNLVANALQGTLPSEIRVLSNLESLNFGVNSLHGEIPDSFGDLVRLTSLQLFLNQLTGTIPQEWVRLSYLGILSLRQNQLEGTIPPDITQLPDLHHLDLAHNSLTGAIPEFANRMELRNVDMSNNLLTGIPESIFGLRDLEVLHLSRNLIVGTISTLIGILDELEVLTLDTNYFSGTLCTEMGRLANLVDLQIDTNQFTGNLPSAFGDLRQLQLLYVSENSLTGSLPEEIGYGLSRLLFLHLYGNRFTGTIPSSFGSGLESLRYLSVSDTDLVGGLEETFCARESTMVDIDADCLSSDELTPQINCTCCTYCCPPTWAEGVCEYHVEKSCNIHARLEESHYNSRGAKCMCRNHTGTNEDDNDGDWQLLCTDVSCESCNKDRTICARNTDYGFNINPDLMDEETFYQFQNTLQYTVGRNDSIRFEKSLEGLSVYVNDMRCDSAGEATCSDGFSTLLIFCGNIIEGKEGSFNGCRDYPTGGMFDVFTSLDETRLSGCRLQMSPGLDFFG